MKVDYEAACGGNYKITVLQWNINRVIKSNICRMSAVLVYPPINHVEGWLMIMEYLQQNKK
jgi:hypothetical protein